MNSKYSAYAPVIVRIALGILFVWFSILQFTNPPMWTGFVPQFVANLLGDAHLVVIINAWFELVAGLMLIAGFQTRIVSLLLALHLFGIAGSIGLKPLGLRDLALSFATLSITFAGADVWTLDRWFVRKNSIQ